MRFKLWLSVLVLASLAYAKEPKAYQAGTLLQMDSVNCGMSEKDSDNLAGDTLGVDSAHKQTKEPMCQEYVLQAEDVIYRIRPRGERHPVLLPIGQIAQFRLQKERMLLRLDGVDNKEREYTVVSMRPRSDSSTADATAKRLNHLQ